MKLAVEQKAKTDLKMDTLRSQYFKGQPGCKCAQGHMCK